MRVTAHCASVHFDFHIDFDYSIVFSLNFTFIFSGNNLELKIIIPTVILIILVIITAYLCYQKRKRKAEETIEVPETKIRLSLLGTQYKIDDEVTRKTSQISQFSKASEASTVEFREKALVDSEFEQTDEIDPPGKYLSVNTSKKIR